jgi:hypothetical protein
MCVARYPYERWHTMKNQSTVRAIECEGLNPEHQSLYDRWAARPQPRQLQLGLRTVQFEHAEVPVFVQERGVEADNGIRYRRVR